jgi:hypothetical protein
MMLMGKILCDYLVVHKMGKVQQSIVAVVSLIIGKNLLHNQTNAFQALLF